MEEHKRKLIVFPVTRFYIREDCRPKEGSLCAQQISISLSGLLSEFRTFQIYRQKSTNIYVYMHPYQKHSFVGVLFRWLQTGNMRDFPTGEGFVVLFSRKMPGGRGPLSSVVCKGALGCRLPRCHGWPFPKRDSFSRGAPDSGLTS